MSLIKFQQFFRKYGVGFTLLTILMLASILIFNHIAARAFWLDEAIVAVDSKKPISQLFQTILTGGHPLVHLYLIKIWSLIFGYSELSQRSFSAVSALILIFVLFKTAKYISGQAKTGLIAAFLGATNYFLIFFAGQNRGYALASLFGLLSFLFFLQLKQKSSRLFFVLYILFTVLGLFTHPWIFFVFGSQILANLLFLKKIRHHKLLWAQATVVLCAIPVVIIYYQQSLTGVSSWITVPNLKALWNSLNYLAFGEQWLYLVVWLIALPFVFWRVKDNQKIKDPFIVTALILYLAATLASAWIVSQFKPDYVIGKYELVVMPAFILITALLVSEIKIRAKRVWDYPPVMIIFVALFIGFALQNVLDDRQMVLGYKSTDETVVNGIVANARSSDVIITTDLSWATVDYYLSKNS